MTSSGFAQDREQPDDQTLADYADQDNAEAVDYPAAFFARYAPNTALDMVNEVPGFQLDDGDATRGFASATGNILINNRRPSAKQDLPSAILARIPASQVERIEVIRGQVRDIDLQGRSVVANVILRDVAQAAVRWRGSLRYNFDFGMTSEGEMSVSDRWGDVEYNAGIQLRDYVRGDFTPMDVLDGNGDLIETRFDVGGFDGQRGLVNMSAATQLGANFASTPASARIRATGSGSRNAHRRRREFLRARSCSARNPRASTSRSASTPSAI